MCINAWVSGIVKNTSLRLLVETSRFLEGNGLELQQNYSALTLSFVWTFPFLFLKRAHVFFFARLAYLFELRCKKLELASILEAFRIKKYLKPTKELNQYPKISLTKIYIFLRKARNKTKQIKNLWFQSNILEHFVFFFKLLLLFDLVLKIVFRFFSFILVYSDGTKGVNDMLVV